MKRLPIIFPAVLVATVLVWSQAFSADASNGRELYEIHCEGCHGIDGRSPDPTIPHLGEGDTTFMLDVELLDLIREGSAAKPAFRGLLSDEEIRDIISYLRTF